MWRRQAWLALILTAGSMSTSAQSPIAVGIVREDGMLIPVMASSANAHQPLLESDGFFASAATTLPGNSWQFWRIGAQKPVAFSTTGRRTVESHCSEQEVWTTSLKASPALKNLAPIDKVGLAIQGAAVVEQPEVVSRQSDQSSRQAAVIIDGLVNLNEETLIRTDPRHDIAGITGTTRSRTAIEISKLLRRNTPEGATYYFEATKSYSESVGLLTSGWVALSGTSSRTTGVEFGPASGESGALTREVVGIVRHGSSDLWVLEEHGYESESYVVFEWPNGVALVRLYGGGC